MNKELEKMTSEELLELLKSITTNTEKIKSVGPGQHLSKSTQSAECSK